MRAIGLWLLGWLVLPLAHADITQPVRFSGFGSFGVAFSDDDGADYTANYEQREGVGRTYSKDYGIDSVFGVQADATLARNLQATAQMQSRRVADGTSTPYFEWANLKYNINEDLSVRGGRVVAPMFMASESRAIGFAHTALRLSPDVYQLNPVSYLDGGGINYQFDINDVIYSANATVGTLEKELPTFFGKVELQFDTRLINLSAEVGASTFRMGYGEATIDFDTPALTELDVGLRLLADVGVAGASTVIASLVHHDFEAQFTDLGYQFDNGRYLVQAEYVIRRSDSFLVYDVDGFSLMAGYRLDRWTPYLRYAQADCINSKADLPALDESALGGLVSEDIAEINDFTGSLKVFDERKTWTVGTRWEVADNYALKVQIDNIRKPAGQAGLFVNTTSEFDARASNVNIYSIVLDFIF